MQIWRNSWSGSAKILCCTDVKEASDHWVYRSLTQNSASSEEVRWRHYYQYAGFGFGVSYLRVLTEPSITSVCLSASVLQFSGLYLLSFFITILGLVLFSSSSTYVAQDPRVYKPFRNIGNHPATDRPPVGAGVAEPSVTYTSLGLDAADELPVWVA